MWCDGECIPAADINDVHKFRCCLRCGPHVIYDGEDENVQCIEQCPADELPPGCCDPVTEVWCDRVDCDGGQVGTCIPKGEEGVFTCASTCNVGGSFSCSSDASRGYKLGIGTPQGGCPLAAPTCPSYLNRARRRPRWPRS